MKTKELKDLNTKTVTELVAQLKKLTIDCAKLSLDLKSGRNRNSGQIQTQRRDIARLQTKINEKKELNEQTA